MTITEIKEEMMKLEDRLFVLSYRGEKNSSEYKEIKDEFNRLEDLYLINTSKLAVSNDEFNIYEGKDVSFRKKYYVTFPNSNRIIATIFANYAEHINIFGNIGYEVKKKYRGHSIAYRALENITPILVERGMKKGVICVNPYNIASINTALKYGAKLVIKSPTPDGINQYEADLVKKLTK